MLSDYRPSNQATLRSALRPQARTMSVPPARGAGRADPDARSADAPGERVVRVGGFSKVANSTMPVGRSVRPWGSHEVSGRGADR